MESLILRDVCILEEVVVDGLVEACHGGFEFGGSLKRGREFQGFEATFFQGEARVGGRHGGEEGVNAFYEGKGGVDFLGGGSDGDFAALGLLEEEAFEGATAFWAVRIDGAFPTAEGGAGLEEEGIIFNFEAGEFEARGFGVGEFDIGKEGTAAAEAAACAENGFEGLRHARPLW